MFINSLLSHATDTHWEEFTSELERPNIRKSVIVSRTFFVPPGISPQSFLQRLMSSHVIDELRCSILDFQANEAPFILRRKSEPVDALDSMDHFNSLRYIWQASKLEEERDGDEIFKWRKIGFDTEDIGQEFGNVGVLGLDCLVSINLDFFPRITLTVDFRNTS